MANDTAGVPSGTPRVPGPGWFPDPGGEAAYRWWDGSTWTSTVRGPSESVSDAPTQPHPTVVRALLIVGAVLFAGWAVLWALAFPLLLLSDADNGRFGHDVVVVLLPEIALGIVGVVLCVTFALVDKGRERWSLLVWPALVAVSIAVWSVVTLPLSN